MGIFVRALTEFMVLNAGPIYQLNCFTDNFIPRFLDFNYINLND